MPNPAPDWLGDKAWGEILRAAELPTVAARGDLPADVAKDPARWKVLYDSLELMSLLQKGGRGVVDASSEGDTARTGSFGELQLCFWRTS